MFGAKNNIHHFILLLSVSSFLIAPVSSIKCYQCLSKPGEDCADEPKKKEYEVECKVSSTDSTEYECMRGSIDIVGTNEFDGTIARACIPKGKECDPKNAVEIPPPTNPPEVPQFTTKWCDTCDSDLCNSTVLLSAEMWILTLSMIIQLQWR